MDKFDRHRGGDRYGNNSDDPNPYGPSARQSRGGGAPFHHQRQDNYRGGGGRNSPHNYRSGVPGGAGRGGGAGREIHRSFDSPPFYPLAPGGDDAIGGGAGRLRPIGEGIEDFRHMVGCPEGFGPMAGGRGFVPMGGGFRPMGGGGSDGAEFGYIGARGNNDGGLPPMDVSIDGGGFPPMGPGGRYGVDNYNITPLPLAGQKRGYPFQREKSPDRGSGSFAKLFVGSVPRTATEEDIRPLFDKHGRVLEVALIKDKRTGQQQGCCFIKYTTSEEADRAIRELHNQYTLPGGMGPIQVRYADGERERLGATEYKLFVGSLSKQASEKDVEQIFSPYGRVEDVYLMRDEMKQSRGCGFVKYSKREMAQAAIDALNGAYTMAGCNQPLTVRFADPKRPRPTESRGGGAPAGPGFGARFPAPGIRPPSDLGEPLHGSRPTLSPQNLGQPSHGNPGLGNQFPGRPGDMAISLSQGTTGGHPGNSEGLVTSSAVSSAPPPQLLQPNPSSFPNATSLQGSHQPGQMQTPHSAGQTGYNSALSSQQQLARNGMRTPQTQVLHNASSAHGQAPIIANQHSLSSQQLPPLSQSQSQLAQMLSQQKENLQATFQSSQQTLSQLQQQLQQLQPSSQNLTAHQGPVAVKQQSHWAGALSQPATNAPGIQSSGDLRNTPAPNNVASVTPPIAAMNCNWTEHMSPDGYKYYYNGVTGESKWEKPEELTLYEQQQQKPSNQNPPMQSNSSGSSLQPQPAAQMQVQFQGQYQSQLNNQAKPLLQTSQSLYQASGLSTKQVTKETGYPQIPGGTGQVNDPARYQQEWMWKNKQGM